MAPRKLYRTVAFDSPWWTPGTRCPKYQMMKTPAILELVSEVITKKHKHDEDGCHLYMWTLNSTIEDALFIGNSLGFKYKTMITWAKKQPVVAPYFQGQTEHVMMFVKGRFMNRSSQPELKEFKQGSTLVNRRVMDKREHSRKPDEFYDEIRGTSPGPFLELFARESRPGWTVWGNQTDKFKKKGKSK